MSLSKTLTSKFAKITKAEKNEVKESTLYGTIAKQDDVYYVIFDGSNLLTPVETTVDFDDGERVTVLLKNHVATVIGNISNPSSSSKTVKLIGERVSTCESEIQKTPENVTIQVTNLVQSAIDNGKFLTETQFQGLFETSAKGIVGAVEELEGDLGDLAGDVSDNTNLINNTNVHRGTTPPANPVAGKTLWVDYSATPPLLKRYTSSAAWETIGTDKFKTSYIQIQSDSVDIGSGGKVNIKSGAGLSVESGGSVNVKSGAGLSVESGGTIGIKSGAGLSVESGAEINIKSGGKFNIKSGAGLSVESGGSVAIKSGGTFTVDASNLDIDGNGTIVANKAELKEATVNGDIRVNGHPVWHSGNIVISSTEPSNPSIGMIWINPNSDDEEERIVENTFYIPEIQNNYIFQNSNNNTYTTSITEVYSEDVPGTFTYTIRLPLYSSNTKGTHYARARIYSEKNGKSVQFPVQTYDTAGLTWYEQSVTVDNVGLGTFATVQIIVETSDDQYSFPSSTGGDMQYRRYQEGVLTMQYKKASVSGGWKNATVKYFVS